MISKTEKKRLKKVFGSGYTHLVLRLLKKDGITAKNGLPLSPDYIRQIFNGKPNDTIESYIYMAAENEIKRQKREKAKRAKILKLAQF